MIDNYLLEYLVLFAQTGRISAVAQAAKVTAPTVSRGLTKLEQVLGVKLFDRQPQKITLTAVGEFAAQRAASLLREHQDFSQAVHLFAQKHQYLKIGGTIPGPLLLLRERYPKVNDDQLIIDTSVLEVSKYPANLANYRYSLIFTTKPSAIVALDSQLVGTERLAIKVTKLNPLYDHQVVSFDELNGHEFIVAATLGEWRAVIEGQIPHAHFIYQSQNAALLELTRHTNFPLFRTNLTHYLEAFNPVEQKRKYIPITGAAASLPVYATYLVNERPTVQPIIDWVKTEFAKI